MTNTIALYKYKDRLYKLLHVGRMKIGQAWIVCIVYQSRDSGAVYVREVGDFKEKFTVTDGVDVDMELQLSARPTADEIERVGADDWCDAHQCYYTCACSQCENDK